MTDAFKVHQQLEDTLIDDEGFRSKPYKDTEGVLTIGYGRNLDDRGITEDEARYLLQNDMAVAIANAGTFLGLTYYDFLTPNRKVVLASMAFQLGLPRLSGFVKFKAALMAKQYGEAADEMLDSAWARQTPNRVKRLSLLMRSG